MEFPRQEYWTGLTFHSPEDLPHPGIKPGSPTLQVDFLSSEPPGKPEDIGKLLIVMGLKSGSSTYYILPQQFSNLSVPYFTDLK